jgi:hypothetical protein
LHCTSLSILPNQQYCSNECYAASRYAARQIASTPLALRTDESIRNQEIRLILPKYTRSRLRAKARGGGAPAGDEPAGRAAPPQTVLPSQARPSKHTPASVSASPTPQAPKPRQPELVRGMLSQTPGGAAHVASLAAAAEKLIISVRLNPALTAFGVRSLSTPASIPHCFPPPQFNVGARDARTTQGAVAYNRRVPFGH